MSVDFRFFLHLIIRFAGTAALVFFMVQGGMYAGAQVEDASQHKSGVLVLKNGRTIAIRGDFELTETEVYFTDSHGRYVTLPLSKVNIEESNRRNMVSDWTGRKQGPRKEIGPVTKIRRPPAPDDGSMPIENSRRTPSGGSNPLPPLDDWQTFEKITNPMAAKDMIEEGLVNAAPLIVALIITFGLTLLISFCTHIFLLVIAYKDGSFWGLTLTLTYLATWAMSFSDLFIDFMPWLMNFSLLLLHHVLVFLFILLECQGSRFKYLFLWLSPFIFLLIAFVTVLIFL